MNEGQEFKKLGPKKTPQDILREKVSKLEFQSSIENIELSELAGSIEQLPSSIRILLGRNYLYLYRDDISDPQYTHAKVLIGRFEIDKNCNITNFIPDVDDSLVSQTMGMLGQVPFFNELKDRFSIKDPDEESLARAKQITNESNRKAEEQQREIKSLKYLAEKNKLKKERRKIDIENDQLVGSVSLGEIGILSTDSQKRYLETLGAGPCVIVTAYDANKKTAAMVHIDGLTNESAALQQLFGAAGTVEMRVLGGDSSSINQLVSIKKILEEAGANVEEWDILNKNKSIILDRETGEIFDVKKGRKREDASSQDSLTVKLRSQQGKQPPKTKLF